MNVPIHKRSYELTVLIYTMARLTMISIVLFTGTSCRGISSATRAKISAWIGSYGKNLKYPFLKKKTHL